MRQQQLLLFKKYTTSLKLARVYANPLRLKKILQGQWAQDVNQVLDFFAAEYNSAFEHRLTYEMGEHLANYLIFVFQTADSLGHNLAKKCFALLKHLGQSVSHYKLDQSFQAPQNLMLIEQIYLFVKHPIVKRITEETLLVVPFVIVRLELLVDNGPTETQLDFDLVRHVLPKRDSYICYTTLFNTMKMYYTLCLQKQMAVFCTLTQFQQYLRSLHNIEDQKARVINLLTYALQNSAYSPLVNMHVRHILRNFLELLVKDKPYGAYAEDLIRMSLIIIQTFPLGRLSQENQVLIKHIASIMQQGSLLRIYLLKEGMVQVLKIMDKKERELYIDTLLHDLYCLYNDPRRAFITRPNLKVTEKSYQAVITFLGHYQFISAAQTQTLYTLFAKELNTESWQGVKQVFFFQQILFKNIFNQAQTLFLSLFKQEHANKTQIAECFLLYLEQSLGDQVLTGRWLDSIMPLLQLLACQDSSFELNTMEGFVAERACSSFFPQPFWHLVIYLLTDSNRIYYANQKATERAAKVHLNLFQAGLNTGNHTFFKTLNERTLAPCARAQVEFS
ncbi:MAG: hypothetical protein A3F18_01065 [Legionellales bacterium RIFCSPHIGHO2_12_FULL_37_14]|nr:MAG: hypothetical protein A3F18_01065 [Legionellales bacterium RIFCSPHIGHO2_12_FULL_37_14]